MIVRLELAITTCVRYYYFFNCWCLCWMGHL